MDEEDKVREDKDIVRGENDQRDITGGIHYEKVMKGEDIIQEDNNTKGNNVRRR